jgi:alpha-mannosidase
MDQFEHPITIHVISHTHWDREWYRTNQEFRVELVSVVDDVIAALHQQEGFFCFTLDGQAILLEDYLGMRPEQTETVRSLIRSGNLLVGPWYTQPDEFLVSGESLVRNLQAGTQTAELYGGSMRVGWVPDAFGHVSQLPQILQNFGIECAALTRGIGNELEGKETDFRWTSSDGSCVVVAHQVQGYYSGGLLGFPYFWGSVESHQPSVELARTRLLRLIEPGGLRPRSKHVALWNGADHLHPEPDLANTLDLLEEQMPGYRIIHSSVPEYVRGIQRDGPDLPEVVGELRGSRYHPLLPSILSSRIDLKQRNAAVQRLLARQSEPVAMLASLLSPFSAAQPASRRYRYPGHALRESWKLLLQNHGHDSIGGCSIDQVHREMRPRFDQAEQIARAVRTMAISRASESVSTAWIPADQPAFCCFAPYDRPGMRAVSHEFVWPVQLDSSMSVLDSTGTALPTQLISVEPDHYRWLEQETNAGNVAENAWWWGEVLRRMDGVGIGQFEWKTADDRSALSFFLAEERACKDQTVIDLVTAARALPADHPVTIEAVFFRHHVTFASHLPAMSITAFTIATADTSSKQSREIEPVGASGRSLHFAGNRLAVEDDGSLSLQTSSGREHRRMVRWIDEGDRGDSYDFSPTNDTPIELSPVDEVVVSVVDSGPVLAALDVRFTAEVPAGLDEHHHQRTTDQVSVTVTLRITVYTGSNRVAIDGQIENHAFDHRLRAWFDADISATHVVADGQFSIEERAAALPDTSDWVQSVTGIRPHQNWVRIADANGALCVHTDGLHEHELIRNDSRAQTLAITLLRCVGWLSRGDLSTRKGQAGPMITTPDAQQQGINRFRFSFEVLSGGASLSPSQCSSKPAFLECVTTAAAPGHDGIDSSISLVSLGGDHLSLTAFQASIRVPGAAIVRVYNTSKQSITEPIHVSRLFDRATRVRLDETPVHEEEVRNGTMMIHAKPAEIVTIRLEAAPHHRVLRNWRSEEGSRSR